MVNLNRSDNVVDMRRKRSWTDRRGSGEFNVESGLAMAQARLDRATASMIAMRSQVTNVSKQFLFFFKVNKNNCIIVA